MKRIYISLLTILLFTGFNLTSNAQPRGLGIINAQILDTTVVVGDTMIVNGTLFNYDTSSAFNGNVNFKLNLNSRDINYGEVEVIQDSMRYLIGPNSGVAFSIRIPIVLPEFQVGPNVVIIWPISNRLFEDSATKIVNVIYPLGYKELAKNNEFSAWLNETGVKIFYVGEEKTHFKRVRIYNIIGNLLYETNEFENNEIRFENQPDQIYLCEFILDNNQRKVLKLIRH